LFQFRQPETAHMTTQYFRAIQLPDELGRRIEMADAKIVINDHDGIVRPLQRGQQEVWRFTAPVIVCAHRRILVPVWKPSRPAPVEGAPCRPGSIRFQLCRKGCSIPRRPAERFHP